MNQQDREVVNQDERDRLLYELVVKQSALEKVLIKLSVLSQQDLAEAQLECMKKIQEIINKTVTFKENSTDSSNHLTCEEFPSK